MGLMRSVAAVLIIALAGCSDSETPTADGPGQGDTHSVDAALDGPPQEVGADSERSPRRRRM